MGRKDGWKVAWAGGLLLVFAFVRTLGEVTSGPPAGGSAALDCDHLATADPFALERCLELRPDDVELMADLGRAYERAAEWDRAEAVYRRALVIDAEDGDIRVRLGHVLLERGDAAGARSEGMAALAVQPGRPAPLDLIGRASASSARGGGR